jgi:phosphate transport system permease protein
MLIASPICVFAAAYLSEHAGRRLRAILRPAIDILAGVPSVVFGLFGVVIVVPAVATLGRMLGRSTTGYSVLAGGIVLAIMVIPFVLSLSLDVFISIPLEAREAALALGATRWETLKKVLFRAAMPGLVAAQVLGFARAFGETMAVVMVVGNVARVPHGLWDAACPIPALLANHFGEMMSIPKYESALMLAALLLLAVVGGFSILARLTLRTLQRSRS